MLRDWQKLDKDALLAERYPACADAYDNCIASLDHDVGRLIDELQTRGLLEKTLLILTSDHGEQFGEHGTFGHGLSVYEPEIHVPLLIISRDAFPAGRVVGEAVSLRDVPATVVDLPGLENGALRSPARRWPRPGASRRPEHRSGPRSHSELDARIEDVPVPRNAPAFDGPHRMPSSSDGNVYIHHGSGAEELYDLDSDPSESHDLSGSGQAAGPILDRCRRILDQLNSTFGHRIELVRQPRSRTPRKLDAAVGDPDKLTVSE